MILDILILALTGIGMGTIAYWIALGLLALFPRKALKASRPVYDFKAAEKAMQDFIEKGSVNYSKFLDGVSYGGTSSDEAPDPLSHTDRFALQARETIRKMGES